MTAGRHFEKDNRHNSAVIWDIFTKFGMLMAMGIPQRPRMSFLGYNKIQDGGQPYSWKTENRTNSGAVWDIVTKFGTMVDIDSLQPAVHNSAAIWVIFTKFGMLVAMDSPQRPLIGLSLLGYNKIQGLFIFIWTNMSRQCSMINNKIITKLLVKWLIKQQILLIKTVTILSRVV